MTLRAGETATFILEQVTDRRSIPPTSTSTSAVIQGHDEFLARLGRPHHLYRQMARRGPPLGARPQAAERPMERVDRRRGHLRAAGDDRWGPQLGLPVLLDPGRFLHPLRAQPARDDRRDRSVHRVARRPVRVLPPRLAADPVHYRRGHRGRRAHAGPPGGIPRLPSGPDRQRGDRSAPARHLRRAAGRDLSLRQVQGVHELQPLGADRGAGGVGGRELAGGRRRRLGGAERQTRVPVLQHPLLGGDRPRDFGWR